MEDTALCLRLMMSILFLLVVQVHLSFCQKSVANFPKVVPNTQQHFQYKSITVSCEGLEGLTGWKVMRKIQGEDEEKSDLKASTETREITSTLSIDSGEYWCEYQDERRSNAVNITVTAGPVILESPAVPVIEGEAVTLRCRNKTTSTKLTAVFYKDGSYYETGSTGEITIHRVSKCDEGLYKCSISGAGESLESRMLVRGDGVSNGSKANGSLHEESHLCPDCFPHGFIALRIFGTVLLVALGLVIAGYFTVAKRGTSTSPPSIQAFASQQTGHVTESSRRDSG